MILIRVRLPWWRKVGERESERGVVVFENGSVVEAVYINDGTVEKFPAEESLV